LPFDLPSRDPPKTLPKNGVFHPPERIKEIISAEAHMGEMLAAMERKYVGSW